MYIRACDPANYHRLPSVTIVFESLSISILDIMKTGKIRTLLLGLGNWYVVKHNCVTIGVVSDYNGQLHVSACTGHLQVVLGELKILL